ncbi:MAG: 2-amino-4-hydroxy-6-hydroxymethyldihydropteridine diphosphokinase [Acidimicrobiaceae bacterium]|nr:2-amino-4-hydroxy-6-hydroxymethyldihydropteridine diphosphokinase [Acidimicrobiia bacterium]MCY4494270.1 2-amino-4-hydroxy-6-hydroxymethyldihydropteridine diphosphokinase [Acidimicrobiaceae bacterium]
MTEPHRAFLGLGSNLGDRISYLREAVAAVPDLAAVSGVYETAPMGGPEQGPYLNLAVQLRTRLGARELLGVCQGLESAAQRVREVRWGARTLDVDVLWVDGETLAEPDLVVPHPRMFERSFVLIPLADLAADLLPDGFDVESAGLQDQVVRLGRLGSLAPLTDP